MDDRVDWDSVGVEAGNVTTEVCVKTWPSDVWRTKETLEVKEALEGEEGEEEEEEALAGGDEDVAPAELDAAALEGVLEGELAAGVEELDGAADDCCAVVGAACEVGAGVGLELVGAALGSAVVAGVVATGA